MFDLRPTLNALVPSDEYKYSPYLFGVISSPGEMGGKHVVDRFMIQTCSLKVIASKDIMNESFKIVPDP